MAEKDARTDLFEEDGSEAPLPPVASADAASLEKRRKPRNASKNGLHARTEKYAAVDLGTNNCRLLIVEPQGSGFRVVDSFSRIVRLGGGLENTGNLSPEAMRRTIEAVRVCAAKIRGHRVKHVRCVATEACRRAENGEAFIRQIEKATRLRFEIIGGGAEAELAAIGCGALFDRDFPNAVVFDIGGGSTEITSLSLKRGRYELMDTVSLPIGVVRLSEKHDGRHMTREVYNRILDEAERMIGEFAARQVSDFGRLENLQLLGTSGTVTTLAAVHLGLPKYDRNRVDGTVMRRADVLNVIRSLMEMPYEERRKNACIGRDRADMVLSGCAVLEAVVRTWPLETLKVADRGLREGILLRLIRKVQRREKKRRPGKGARDA